MTCVVVILMKLNYFDNKISVIIGIYFLCTVPTYTNKMYNIWRGFTIYVLCCIMCYVQNV